MADFFCGGAIVLAVLFIGIGLCHEEIIAIIKAIKGDKDE